MEESVALRMIDVKVVGLLILGLFSLAIYLIKIMHTQAMKKADKFTDSMDKMSKSIVVHAEKLESGSRQFEKIEEHQKIQDHTLREHGKEIIKVKEVSSRNARDIAKLSGS